MLSAQRKVTYMYIIDSRAKLSIYYITFSSGGGSEGREEELLLEING
jgi:hypothetical protein